MVHGSGPGPFRAAAGPPYGESDRRQRSSNRAEVQAAALRVRVSDSGSVRAASRAITRVEPWSTTTTADAAVRSPLRSSQKRVGALAGRPSSIGSIAHTPWRGAGQLQVVRSAGRKDTTTSSGSEEVVRSRA